MNRNVLLGGVFAALLAAVVLLLYLNFGAPAAAPAAAGSALPGTRTPGARLRPALARGALDASPVPVPAARKKTVIKLYFEGAEDAQLYPEEREADETIEPAARARLVLEELVKGSARELLPTVPQGTSVHEVYLDPAGVAYVDFSHEIRDSHMGGSEGEIMTVESVVNSVVANVPEVSAVQILIEGRPVATLAGHLDLSAPLRPSSDVLAVAR